MTETLTADINASELEHWRRRLPKIAAAEMDTDAAHDLGHLARVARAAEVIAQGEGQGAEPLIVLAASWLHDLVNLPKDSPDRARASTLSADRAIELLAAEGFPRHLLPGVHHAIAAHSWSAQITAETLEAQIVQDADRMESFGLIAISRTMAVSAKLGRPLWNDDDPLCRNRAADETLYGLDHVYEKLKKLPEHLNTATAKRIGERRMAHMDQFLATLEIELSGADLED
ncbi:MAG: HD domain-containing protein [Alphaproteobacteria bacterium]